MANKSRKQFEGLRQESQQWLDYHRQTGDFTKHDIWAKIESRYKRRHKDEYQRMLMKAVSDCFANEIGRLLREEKHPDDPNVRVYGCYTIKDEKGTRTCWKQWQYMMPSVFRQAWEEYVERVKKDLVKCNAQEAYCNSLLKRRKLKPLDSSWRDDCKDIIG